MPLSKAASVSSMDRLESQSALAHPRTKDARSLDASRALVLIPRRSPRNDLGIGASEGSFPIKSYLGNRLHLAVQEASHRPLIRGLGQYQYTLTILAA